MSVDRPPFDLSLLPPYLLSFNLSLGFHTNKCFRSETSVCLFSAFFIANLLLLPFFMLVFHLSCQRRRRQSSASKSAASRSDHFIHQSIAMQLMILFGLCCFVIGGYFNLPKLMVPGLYLWSIGALGQGLFHILTSVEHYVAVVQPITYLHLRQAGGVGMRAISTGCVWLLTSGWLAVCFLTSSTLYFILYCSYMVFVLAVVSFCSVSVLCALKRPGPGQTGGGKERGDHTKTKAFFTITAIMGVLLIRFIGNLTGNLIYSSRAVNPDNICVVFASIAWLDLPSSLVLPLLFLQRVGKIRKGRSTHHMKDKEGKRKQNE